MKRLLPFIFIFGLYSQFSAAAFDSGVWSESSVSQTFSQVREVATETRDLEEEFDLDELCKPPEKCGKAVKAVNCEKPKATQGC